MKTTRRRVLLLALPIILGGAMWLVAHAHRQRAVTQKLWAQIDRLNQTEPTAAASEVERLLLLGADPNAPHERESANGRTMLERAAFDSPEIVRLLLDHGANVNAARDTGLTPLIIAASRQPEIVRLLLDSGANVHVRDDPGQSTPLHHAAAVLDDVDNTAAIKLLVRHGADVNAANIDGDRPLHYAIMCKNVPSVRALLQCGTSVQAKSNRFGTPLHQATHDLKQDALDSGNWQKPLTEIVRLLRQAGAKK